MLGTLLNKRYRIVSVLGGGGFGKTFIAEDTQQSPATSCVIKQFQPNNNDESFLQIARRLFKSEADTLRRLGSHDQIPALIDSFEIDNEFYLVLEYVEGQSLSQQLTDMRRLDEPAVLALLQDVLEILEFVHRNQVIHRDIKPGNLILRKRDHRYVLIDFGAVKEIHTQINTELLQTGYTVGIGTQGYGPSEQLMGKPRYNSDIYALGMTAIHALTGLQPSQLPTHPDTGEVIWQDQALVSPRLAAILSRMVRYHFSERYASATEVLQALAQPTELILEETQAPMVMDGQQTDLLEDTASQPTRVIQKRDRRLLAPLVVGVCSLLVSGVVGGLRGLGSLQPAELAVYDQMVHYGSTLGPDPRLVIVAITDTDIQNLRRFPVPDEVIARLLEQLQTYQPRVIGLDLLRDIPQPPGNAELLQQLRAKNVITILNLGEPPTPAPPGTSLEQVGFNDLLLDPGDVVRRNLLFLNIQEQSYYSFALRLALSYLQPEGIEFANNQGDRAKVQLGSAHFVPLEASNGGYQKIDARGYQILLRYRGQEVARQITLSEVLEGNVQPEWFHNRVVLIGTTALTARDLFSTPYSASNENVPRMPGVMIHAQMVSQIIDAALGQRSLFWFWAEWGEWLWLGGWAILGGSVAWLIRHPLWLGMVGTGLMLLLVLICYSLFLLGGWVPLIAPAMASMLAGGVVTAYRAYASQRLEFLRR